MSLTHSFRPTFMLLPSFDFSPSSSQIQLGTLIGRSRSKPQKGHKAVSRPDPSRPFNTGSTIPPIPDETPSSTQVLEDFHVNLTETSGGGGDIFADIPILSAIGGKLGFDCDRKDSLEVDCRAPETGDSGENTATKVPSTYVERIAFSPSTSYITQAIEGNKLARDYVTRDWWRGLGRSLFMVTGLMVVHGDAIVRVVEARGTKGEGEVSVDLTSPTAGTVPLRVGAGGHGNRGKDNIREMVIKGPFILSYRLRRVRVDRKGKVRSEADYNEFALMEDEDAGVLRLENEEVDPQLLETEWDEADSDEDSDE